MYPAVDLGAIVIKEALERAGVAPEHVDEVIMGNVLQAGSDKIQQDKQQLKRDCQKQFQLWRLIKYAVLALKRFILHVKQLFLAMRTLLSRAVWKT